MALCPGCYADLPWIKQACIRCALPISSNNAEAAICGSCLKKPPSIDQSHCLFIYDYPIDRIISALKFNQQLIYGHLLGQLLANHITEKYKDQKLPDAIIPVPLHNSRLRERGFNQAQEIARICSRQLSIPLAWQLCKRIKATPHQIGLDAATRRHNLRNAFQINSPKPPHSIALVDDVMTTGSTLLELSRALRRAGVGEIHTWCIARTVTNPKVG